MSVIQISKTSLDSVELRHVTIPTHAVNLGHLHLLQGVVFKNNGPGVITIGSRNMPDAGGFVIGVGESTEKIATDNLEKIWIVASEPSVLSWCAA